MEERLTKSISFEEGLKIIAETGERLGFDRNDFDRRFWYGIWFRDHFVGTPGGPANGGPRPGGGPGGGGGIG